MATDTASSSGGVNQGPQKWSNLFAKGLDSCSLQWVQTEMDGNATVVPKDILDHGAEIWKDHLVGYFVDKKMPYFLVKKTVEREWKVKGGLEISTDGKLYYFKFSAEEDRQRVLEGGPTFVAGRILVIRPWSEDIYDEKSKITSVPIWVKCYDVPMHLWSDKGFSLIGSKIGKPMCCDEATMKRSRLDYAKLCIEVSASTNFPTTLKFKLGEGKIAIIGVEYSWKPQVCCFCEVFRHYTRNCYHKREHDKYVAQAKGKDVVVEQREDCNMQIVPVNTEVITINEMLIDTFRAGSYKAQVGQPVCINSFSLLDEVAQEEASRVEDVTTTNNALVVIDDEIDPCFTEEGLQEVVAETVEQYEAEKEAFHEMYEDGQIQEFVEPIKEIEVFRDHIIKVDSQSASSINSSDGSRGGNLKKKKYQAKSQVPQVTSVGRGRTRSSSKGSSSIEVLPLAKSFFATLIYASNHKRERRSLWSDLKRIQPAPTEAWVVEGDFNCVLASNERFGCAPVHPSEVEDFADCVSCLGLSDLQFSRSFFTWNKTEGRVRKGTKIDRCLVNLQWISLFPATSAEFKVPLLSDHSPILLSWFSAQGGVCPFRFNNAWVLHPSFHDLVEEVWHIPVGGNPFFRLTQKLKKLKEVLKPWAKDNFSNLSGRVVEAREKLEVVQKFLEVDVLNLQLIEEEKIARISYSEILKMEYEELRLKSHCSWMLNADKCTTFFYGVLKERKGKNKIWSVSNSNGCKITDRLEVQNCIVQHYEQLMGTQLSGVDIDLSILEELEVQQVLSEEDCELLSQEVTADEIKESIFAMDSYTTHSKGVEFYF
ncbi:Dnase i-like superfamily protein [Thalictrum thalictroides]|uniref:Dnase i-like superfamily protein n=1 Tax=Thalictrum thalictroides TaxID=46969 RepID=A0A7J6WR30_THATH|nr:Dnase i-like superfamily protein [Thalictrum thalictroides]